MKKPTHPLLQFAFLFGIAVPLLLAFCFAIDRTFLDDPAAGELLGDRGTVYNLSLGGMTLAEKQWILRQAVQLVDFDSIIVAMTLWDSGSDGLRPWLARPRDRLPGASGRPSSMISWPAPATINRSLTDRFTRALAEAVGFFRHRTAIRRWLKETTARALRREARLSAASRDDSPPATEAADAEPVSYAYSEQEQAIVLDRIDAFLSSLRAIRSSSGAAIMVMLTPFRQDPVRPAYQPPAFYDRFRDTVERACARGGLVFLDASSLLGQSHFGLYGDGPDAGRIDVLHFDASGHDLLTGAIEESSLFRQTLRAAK